MTRTHCRLIAAAFYCSGLLLFAQDRRIIAQDADGDGIPDAEDPCPLTATLRRAGDAFDGTGNACNCQLPAARIVEWFPPGAELPRDAAFAKAAVGVGDIDGDGIEDLAVAAPRRPLDEDLCLPPAESNTSLVYFHSGSSGRIINSQVIREIEGHHCGALGFALARVDPIGSEIEDGETALAIGAPCALGGRGELHVVILRGEDIRAAFPPRAGDAPGDLLGTSVACAGDTDEDGDNEILVGAPGHSGGGEHAGKVLLLDGDGTVIWEREGQGALEGFGWAVASAGLFDADARPDVIAGSQSLWPGGDACGGIRVFSSAGELILSRTGETGERLGVSVAAVGRIDGDEFADVLVGASFTPPLHPCVPAPGSEPTGPGRVYLLAGGNASVEEGGVAGRELHRWTGPQPGSSFGRCVASAGDVNRDGVAELIIAAPDLTVEGRSRAGMVLVYDGSDFSPLWSFSGSRENATVGRSVCRIGDLDQDGVSEVVIGSVLRRGEDPPFPAGHLALFPMGEVDGNAIRDACQVCASPTVLTAGETQEFTVTRLFRARCFRFDAHAGRALRFRTSASSADDRLSIFARWDVPASPAKYDYTAAGADADDPGLFLPATREGVLYLYVNAPVLAGDVARGTIQVEEIENVFARRMIPCFLEPEAPRQLRTSILGGRFSEGVAFTLRARDGESSYQAADITLIDEGLAQAAFDLAGPPEAPAGDYDLEARQEGSPSFVLPEAFRILSAPPGSPAYRVSIEQGGTYRNSFPARVTLRVENTGATSLPPLLFRLAGPEGSAFSFSGNRLEFSGEALGLAYHILGPDGSIPPGDVVEIPVWFRKAYTDEECPHIPDQPFECSGELRLEIFEPGPEEEFSWLEVEPPPGLDDPAGRLRWEEMAPRLGERFGSTWKEYHQGLISLAGRLARRGKSSGSAFAAFELALREFLGKGCAAVTGAVIDAGTGAPLGGAIVVAVDPTGTVASFSPVTADGFFSVDWLDAETAYWLEVVEPRSGEVHESDRPLVTVGESGERLGIRIEASRSPGGTGRGPFAPACGNCDATGLPRAPISPPEDLFNTHLVQRFQVIGSFDPNVKDGSGTQGGDVDIDVEEEIEYTISFENLADEEGGAAARLVRIEDALDPALDWTSVAFRSVFINIQPEPIEILCEEETASGDPVFLSSVPSDPGGCFPDSHPTYGAEASCQSISACREVEVQFLEGDERTVRLTLAIEAWVTPVFDAAVHDEEYGLLTWEFHLLDAEVAPDIAAENRWGFLAYGCEESEEGELNMCGGQVSFTVKPRPSSGEPTVVENTANIYFDLQEAVPTEPSATVTISLQSPSVPEALTPLEEATEVDADTVRFVWQSAYATCYDFFLWEDTAGEPDEALQTIFLTTPHYPEDDGSVQLSRGKQYFWQVLCHDDRGQTLEETPIWSFSTAGEGIEFRRGDVDASGRLDITDPIITLHYLFLGDASPSCMDAQDSDDNGKIDITDPIRSLSYLFLGGATIPLPGPVDCGTDPTEDSADVGGELGCVEFTGCAR
ncbi:MAG: FG-GAP repeat protein [Planctomycetes bacterium]|nr:FG-GAP repeat protein [Planctomycetota bacterium]